MRIIAGTHRGRTLKSTQTSMLRPTTDRVRESIFNILASRVELEGARVLDLFAGTGALGFEALSRGAAFCEFVESDRRAAAVIIENAEAFGFIEQTRLHVRDVLKFLAATPDRFDIVFADPPYAATTFDAVARALVDRRLLTDGGLAMMEHAGAMRIAAPPGGRLLLERSFGDTAITMLTLGPADDVEAREPTS